MLEDLLSACTEPAPITCGKLTKGFAVAAQDLSPLGTTSASLQVTCIPGSHEGQESTNPPTAGLPRGSKHGFSSVPMPAQGHHALPQLSLWALQSLLHLLPSGQASQQSQGDHEQFSTSRNPCECSSWISATRLFCHGRFPLEVTADMGSNR